MSSKKFPKMSLRAFTAAAVAVSASALTAFAGVVDARYDLQYYMDFAYNKGMFSVGATNISVYYADGTSVSDPVIALMPNLDGYGRMVTDGNFAVGGTASGHGGCGLISAQFVAGAKHVGENDVYFLAENNDGSTGYESAGYTTFSVDTALQRLEKIVTEVTYNAAADDAFMRTLTTDGTWLYRLGDGMYYNSDGNSVSTGMHALGGIINITSISQDSTSGCWTIDSWFRENDIAGDTRTPLDNGVMFGDSGSPVYAWDAENQRFVYVAFVYGGNVALGYNSWTVMYSNPTALSAGMDSFTVNADRFSGTEKIIWSEQDAATGTGTLTQGDVVVNYTGKGTDNTISDTLGLTFTTSDTENVQTLELQGSVDMGAGAMTFDSGSWKLTETSSDLTFNSAGFVVNEGAKLTLELTATSSEEWRKVGEGTLTIAGSGNNEAVLVVGGGTTKYNLTYDESGNITGCTLGNAGETRLDRTDGYAASSVRLEAGVAIVVLMQDNQFKTNSVAGDTFTFGNDGGLLNLNGHNLEWGVINQDESGTGARIGNFTPLGESVPGKATFTYTGTGTFAGCFMDEGAGDNKAQLAVVYNNSAEDATWTLTGNHSNVGGFTVQDGTMILQGTNTPHVRMTDADDWTYATLEGSDVTVKSGATFRLSHHALMSGNVVVEDGGSFVMTQSVNAASESISGSLRKDMASLGITSLIGNVTLGGNASMTADMSSPVTTTMKGNITGTSASFTKTGSGLFVADGTLSIGTGTVSAGGLIVNDKTDFAGTWKIEEAGFLGVKEMSGTDLLKFVDTTSSGVLALGADQTTQLDLTNYQNLIIGALGNISYGSSDVALNTVSDATYGNVWRLGGGTGTLTVNFKLTGDADLLIGNDYSSGTVHLANTSNDFSGDIIIQGTGNKLTYENGALGSAKVALSYGNALALYEASQLGIVKSGSDGVLALGTSEDLDLSGTSLAVGANGDFTYTGTLTVSDDTYRFGGSGNLTLDADLSAATQMKIDGQGTTGSSVTFAREDAFTGTIVAGGGLQLSEANSAGGIGIHVGHGEALAAATAVTLQKGATLYTDGQSIEVANLTLESGSALQNNGTTNSLVLLSVGEGKSTTIADGTLVDANNTAGLSLVKSGAGTLTMGANSSWAGGLTIAEGTVAATITASGSWNSAGGIGSADNVIYVDKNGTLKLSGVKRADFCTAGTILNQEVRGTGTIDFSTGGEAFFSTQTTSFEGTLKLTGNTRLTIGNTLETDGSGASINTAKAVEQATIEISDGSQVRVTSSHRYLKNEQVSINTDFVISGAGFKGSYGTSLKQGSLTTGALSVDLNSVVYGNVTLAADATIASWSSTLGSAGSACSSAYGIKNSLGGTIRGKILGEGKTLTIGGNEGMTLTADSENTFGNLVIANGNGNNDDQFALRLDGGNAKSQTSTALGTGTVTLNQGLTLRLAGTGTENQSAIVYTYGNAINAGDASTLQSYNITNKLAGTVTMSGTTLNLATANGGVLDLAGGVSGSGTLNIAASSEVILGGSSKSFSGNIASGAGTSLTLASASSVADNTVFTGTDSLTLNLGGTDDYSLGTITMSASAETATSLALNFDFSGDISTTNYTTLTTSGITAGSTVIGLSLNLFNDIESGEYTLVKDSSSGTTYSLADNLDGRLSLASSGGNVVLTVGKDTRYYWSSSATSQNWTEANWLQESSGESLVNLSETANVVLAASGVDSGNSAASRETISVTGTQTVGCLAVKESFYEISGDGSLSAETLVVGLDGDLKLGNTGGNTFSGGVTLNNGSLTVCNNTLTANVAAENGSNFTLENSATLSGALTLTDSAATISDSTVSGDITISENSSLSLSAAQFSGARTLSFATGTLSASDVNLGGKFTADAERSVLQVSDMSVSSGTVSASVALEVDSLNMSSGTLSLTHASGTTALNSVSGDGSITKDSAGVLTLVDAALSGLTLKGGGTTTISGNVTVSSQLSLGKETLSLVSGANLTVGQYTSGNTANGQPTQVYVGEGASLSITGTSDGDATNASFLLSHWKTSSSMLVLDGGSVSSENTRMHMGWNSGSVFKAQSGTATLKGILFSSTRSNADTLLLGSETAGSARLNIGTGGISGIGTNDIVSFGNGTVGAIADFAISGSNTISLVGTLGGTVFDTSGYTITVNNGFSGSGKLVKQGEGTLSFLGSNDNFNGTIAIQGGTLAVNATSSNLLTNATSVTVGAGTLDLSAIEFGTGSDTSNALALTAGHAFSFGSDAIVKFAALQADTEYNIFNLSGGSLEGWSSLTVDNFVLNGKAMADVGRVELSFGMNGSFAYTVNEWDLIWNGGATGTWDVDSANTPWQTTREVNGIASAFATSFVNQDNVTFNSSAELTLADDIVAGTLTVADNVELTLSGGSLTASAISVGAGATLSLDASRAGYTDENISGSGTVKLNFTQEWTNGVKLGSGFTGETYVTGGYIDLAGAQVGTTLRLADGVNADSAAASATLSANLILEGQTVVHANSGNPIVYAGTVTGENGVFISNGGASHTFNAEVDLKGYQTGHASNTNTFNAKASFDSVEISQATTNFNGETAIATATFSGGTTNFNGDTALTTATFSGGTVNFATDSLTVDSFVRNGGNVNFKLAAGTDSTSYTLQSIGGTGSGTISIDEGVKVAVSQISHSGQYHAGSLDINGELSVSGELALKIGSETISGNGVVNVGGNTTIMSWGNTNISVKELNVSGNANFASYYTAHTINLTAGTLSVGGALSISQNNGALSLNISGGELKMRGGATLSDGTINLSDSGTLTQAGGTSTISNTFSMTGGTLNVSGGSMSISSTPTVSGGNINVTGGTLALASAEAASAIFGGATSIALCENGILDLSAITFNSGDSADNTTIALGASTTFSVSGGVLAFGDLTAGTTYNIFDSISGGTLSGWTTDTLSVANFSVNGTSLADMTRASLTLGESGTFSYAIGESATLYWDSSATNWNTSDASWDASSSDGNAENNEKFYNGDSVVFASDASVAVADGVRVGDLALDDGANLTTTGGISVGGTLSVAENASWTLANTTQQSLTEAQLKAVSGSLVVAEGATLTMTDKTTAQNNTSTAFDKVSGAGDVVLNLAADNGIGFDLSGISGDITVATGRLQVNTSTFNEASTIRLASADAQLVFNASGTDLKNNVSLETSTTFHGNINCSGTISGVISGECGLTKAGAGALTFKAQNTYTGTTTISGGKIVLDTGSDYVLYNSVSNGTLEVARGTTLKNDGKQISSALVLNDGSKLLLTAGDSGVYAFGNAVSGAGLVEIVSGTTANFTGSKTLGGSVTVNSGATLCFSAANSSDTLNYDVSGKTITVDGGTVDFGSTRQTMGSWGITLKNGAKLTGTGGSYTANSATHYAALDFNNNATINVTSGTDNEISATTRLRDGNSRTLTYNVSDGAELTVSGRIHADNSTANLGNIVKSGAGKLTVSSEFKVNSLNAQAGELLLLNQNSESGVAFSTFTLADSTTVSAYTGTTAAADYEAGITVSGTATFGAGAHLNANLTLASGSTLEVAAGGLSMGSTVTLERGITLGTSTLASVNALSAGESLTLFTGVDQLILGSGDNATIINPNGEISSEDALASNYFSNLSGSSLTLYFTGTEGNGTLGILAIPEPSLFGLFAGLGAVALAASRRRMKSKPAK